MTSQQCNCINIDSIESSLNKLGIKRPKGFHVGKKVGDNLWFHKMSMSTMLTDEEIRRVHSICETQKFEFDVVRLSLKSRQLCLIECPEFFDIEEPAIERSLVINEQDFKITNSSKNKMIYHHKWQMLPRNYDTEYLIKSMQRSLKWKSILGVDRAISSRIGRQQFWEQWLKDNNV